jgi:hypothetical protein
MVIHRGGGYNSGPIGASMTLRGHAGKENRSSLGEGFRIAEDVIEGDDQAVGARAAAAENTFDTALALAQSAERAKWAQSGGRPK